MKLLAVGLNWKAPLSVREPLSMDQAKCLAALAQWRAKFAEAELCAISTCNRTELIVARHDQAATPHVDDVVEFLADVTGLAASRFMEFLYFFEDAQAVSHLFQVAAGLDSLVLGEGQILGQVRKAYQWAVDAGCAGPGLHSLFQKALNVARKVQTETDLSKGRLSIASAAIEYLHGVFERLSDKAILVIGAGKMAELVLTHLAQHKPRSIAVCNRNQERGKSLADRFAGKAVGFDRLFDALVEADVVISSTGADEPIFRARQAADLLQARRNRLLAIIDIAVPRDFESKIAEFDNILLWNLDDLEKVRFRTLRAREKSLDAALKIVDEQVALYDSENAFRHAAPVIGRLELEFGRIMEQELDWLMPQLNGIGDKEKDKIRQFAHRLKSKFLHHPKTVLRESSRTDSAGGLVDAFRKIFRLDDRH